VIVLKLRLIIHSTLPEELRSALTLREFDGLSYEDISFDHGNAQFGTVSLTNFSVAREAVKKQHHTSLFGWRRVRHDRIFQ